MNVQYVHAALSARRAWPSFSCRCVSTGEACQTPGSPFQRCQRTFRALSGARIENKGGENKGGEGGRVFVVSTKATKRVNCKNDKKQWILHIPCYSFICVTCHLHKVEKSSINCGQSGGNLIPPVWFCPHPWAV